MKISYCFIFFILTIPSIAQTEKPVVFLSQIEMTASGGQPYDEFYWLNSNYASLTKTGVLFSKTGSYRVDVSAYKTAGTPVINVLVDGISKGNITVNSTAIAIYSLFVSNITSGTHTIKLQLSNFNSAANHVRVGLIYFTQTSQKTPYVYPSIVPIPLVPNQILQRNHFGSGHLRGFNLAGNGTNQQGEDDQGMKDMIKTGANIARCFVEIYRPSGDTYVFKSGELTKLDTTIARAARLGFYVVPVLFHDPSYNTDYWGTSSGAVARRNSITQLWKTIATKYKNSPAVGAYDLINEPRSNFNYAECIRWQQDMVNTIRAIDAKHVCMVECIDNDMFAMMLPLPDTNIVYSPHGYSPINITHQGVPGEPEANIRNKYPTVKTTRNQGVFGKSDLSKQHDDVRIMSHRFHVPMFIGEFSCVNWAPKNDSNGWSSTKWCNDNISLLEAEGWSWVYHAWRGDWPAWEAEIPSSYYTQFSFVNAAPQNLPDYNTWIKARSSNAPTIKMLRKWFALNAENTYVIRSGDSIFNFREETFAANVSKQFPSAVKFLPAVVISN
jgi:hypothetical protein